MLGGAYLCFEGAEKVAHAMGGGHGHDDYPNKDKHIEDPAALEEEKAAGAIKTDFILSAEIMTISLAAIEADGWVNQAIVLGVVAIGITALVYGAVALLVKMDDVGIKLSQVGRLEATRNFGRGMVKAMPGLMKFISIVGTAAMLWVGGNIIVHGLKDLGMAMPYDVIHDASYAVSGAVGVAKGFVGWLVVATLDGILGLFLGLLLMPIVNKAIAPVFSRLFPEKKAAAH